MSEADEVRTHRWKVPALAGAVVVAAGLLAAAVVMAGGDSDGDADPADPSEQASAESSGCEVIVFLTRDVTEDQRAAVESAVAAHPDVASYNFLDQAESLAEFERWFARNQAMLDRVHANTELIPTSFRITPTVEDPETLQALTAEFGALPGVYQATSPAAAWDATQDAGSALGVC